MSPPGAQRPSLKVWVWDLAQIREAVSGVDARALLTLAELERAGRYRSLQTAQEYTATHIAARSALSELLGVPLRQVVLGTLACPGCGDLRHGPPGVLAGRGTWRISLSRTAGHAVLAALEGHPVGIDVERPHDLAIDLLAEVTLTHGERARVAQLPPGEQHPAFYRAWTRKEAVLKAIGVGIAGGVDTVDVHPETGDPAVVAYTLGGTTGHWLVSDLDLGAGLAAAVAQPAALAAPITVLRPELVALALPHLDTDVRC